MKTQEQDPVEYYIHMQALKIKPMSFLDRQRELKLAAENYATTFSEDKGHYLRLWNRIYDGIQREFQFIK